MNVVHTHIKMFVFICKGIYHLSQAPKLDIPIRVVKHIY